MVLLAGQPSCYYWGSPAPLTGYGYRHRGLIKASTCPDGEGDAVTGPSATLISISSFTYWAH